MNLKRHHVLYALLAVSLIILLLVLLTPGTPRVSFMPQPAPQSAQASSSAPLAASSTQASAIQPMHFEIVTTPAQQERGLGGRADIPENYGMLFVFPQEGKPGFWMKDMLVPIDIIWLADDGTILGIEDSFPPDSYPQIVYPPKPVKYVLETRAGEARRRGWSVGSQVALPSR